MARKNKNSRVKAYAYHGGRESSADCDPAAREQHLTTCFPEVRLKRYMEMRGADGGPWSQICALPAVWVGLLYDEQALTDAEALVVRGEGRGVSSSVGVIFFWFVYFYFYRRRISQRPLRLSHTCCRALFVKSPIIGE